jgi:ectoine hydroxylase
MSNETDSDVELLSRYAREGLVFVRQLFKENEIDLIAKELPGIFSEESPGRILERDGKTVRSVLGCHLKNRLFGRLVRDPRLVNRVRRILDSDIYVHQFKINAKAGGGGDLWAWHQDWIYWSVEDGMPESRVVNVMIFLGEVTPANGPICLIPFSHREGTLVPLVSLTRHPTYETGPDWITTQTRDLKYTVADTSVKELSEKYGIIAPTGPSGSTLFFHPNLVHGSSVNTSSTNRPIAIISYNSVQNALRPVKHPRPGFIASRDFTPLVAISESFATS